MQDTRKIVVICMFIIGFIFGLVVIEAAVELHKEQKQVQTKE